MGGATGREAQRQERGSGGKSTQDGEILRDMMAMSWDGLDLWRCLTGSVF